METKPEQAEPAALLKVSSKTHLFNFGCDAPDKIHYLHVSFNKQTGQVEEISVTRGVIDVTSSYDKERISHLKRYARKQYREQYKHNPEEYNNDKYRANTRSNPNRHCAGL